RPVVGGLRRRGGHDGQQDREQGTQQRGDGGAGRAGADVTRSRGCRHVGVPSWSGPGQPRRSVRWTISAYSGTVNGAYGPFHRSREPLRDAGRAHGTPGSVCASSALTAHQVVPTLAAVTPFR